jgi:hypothetical protein
MSGEGCIGELRREPVTLLNEHGFEFGHLDPFLLPIE